MPSHNGVGVRPSQVTKVFQGTGQKTSVVVDLQNFAWDGLLFRPTVADDNLSTLSIEDIVKAVVTDSEDIVTDAIGFATGGIETDHLVCQTRNEMFGEMYTFVVYSENDINQIAIEHGDGRVNVFLTQTPTTIQQGELIRINKEDYVSVKYLDWDAWLKKIAKEANVPVNDIPFVEAINYHVSKGHLFKVSTRPTIFAVDDAAASLRKK